MQKHLEDLPQPKTKWLEPQDFEFLCFETTRKLLISDEPIPDYDTRDSSLLESALASHKQTFDNKLLYPTLPKQAAILFYSLIKNHPFKNGNKRIAIMSLLVFLSLNDQWLAVSSKDLYEVALYVSESKPRNKDLVMKKIEQMINGVYFKSSEAPIM